MRLRRIRGNELDGTTVTVTIGKYQFDALAVSYGDSLQPEKLRQMGSQEIDAMTPGTYETEEGKLRISASVWRGEVAPLLEQNGWGNTEHNVVVSFTHPQIGSDSDMLSRCRLISGTDSHEVGSKPLEHEIKLVYQQVYWTDDRKTINRMGDVYQTPGISRLD